MNHRWLRLAHWFCSVGGALSLAAATQPPPPTPPVAPGGVLRSTPLRLTPPPDVLAQMHVTDCSEWSFADLTTTDVVHLLTSVGLTPEACAELFSPAHQRVAADGHLLILRVPDELRLNLPPTTRAALYRQLARFETNPLQRLPRVLPTPALIDRAQLNPALRAALDQLTFPREQQRCLVDADLLLPLVRDPAEFRRLKQLLFSVPSLSVELVRPAPSDLPATMAYWSHPATPGVPAKLRAFATNPALEAIDLTTLLPPLARRVINSFPDNLNSPRAANCFWTALNFGRLVNDNELLPNSRDFYHSAKVAEATLTRDYTPIEPPYRFGDVLTFWSTARIVAQLEHAMVYLADDIVLSKNGVGEFTPFSLNHLDDVARLYAWAGDQPLRAFRLRPVTGPTAPPASPPAGHRP